MHRVSVPDISRVSKKLFPFMEGKAGDFLERDLLRPVRLLLEAQDLMGVGHLPLDLSADPLTGFQM